MAHILIRGAFIPEGCVKIVRVVLRHNQRSAWNRKRRVDHSVVIAAQCANVEKEKEEQQRGGMRSAHLSENGYSHNVSHADAPPFRSIPKTLTLYFNGLTLWPFVGLCTRDGKSHSEKKHML